MKKIILLICTLSLCFAPLTSAHADEPEISAQSALAVDIESGKILYAKDSETVRPIGGLTTLLTTYLVYEAVQNKELSMKDPVSLSESAINLSTIEGLGTVPMEARSYTVNELLTALLVGNSSSAALALAEHISGTENQFVEKMKSKLKEWGIKSPHLINATGLSSRLIDPSSQGKNDENKLSAIDVAIIASHLLRDFPEVTEITSKPTALFSHIQIENPNWMLEGMPSYRSGVDGLKVTNSDTGGISFAASTTQNGIHMLTVLLDVEAIDGDPYARFVATSSLMNYVVRTYMSSIIVKKGDPYDKHKVKIRDGKQGTVTVVAKNDFYIVERQGNQNTPKIEFKASQAEFTAPISTNITTGRLTYTDPDKIGRGYLETENPYVEMVPETSIEKSFFLRVWWNSFVRYVNEKL